YGGALRRLVSASISCRSGWPAGRATIRSAARPRSAHGAARASEGGYRGAASRLPSSLAGGPPGGPAGGGTRGARGPPGAGPRAGPVPRTARPSTPAYPASPDAMADSGASGRGSVTGRRVYRPARPTAVGRIPAPDGRAALVVRRRRWSMSRRWTGTRAILTP